MTTTFAPELGPTAKGDGFQLSFEVKSEYGTWEAVDLEMLDVRVKEVYSLAQLSDVSKTEIFAQAFGKAAEQKARALGRAVTDPVGTAKAIPGGLARFAKGLARTAQGTADPVIANQKDAPPDDRSTTETAEVAAIAGATAAGNALVAGKRREWAQEVGADPYTSNPQLSPKLDQVYEPPIKPEIALMGYGATPEENARIIVKYLEGQGYLNNR